MQKTNNKAKIVVALLLIIIWMIIIFIFSAMAGDDSSNLSSGVLHTILKIVPGLAENPYTHLIIRKLAHGCEYVILSLLIVNLEYQINNKINIKTIIIAIVGSFLYACTDEWHQTFVSGRSGNIVDVGIDTLGATIAGIIVYLSYLINRKRRKV